MVVNFDFHLGNRRDFGGKLKVETAFRMREKIMDEFQYVRTPRMQNLDFDDHDENLVSQIPTPDQAPTPARNTFPNLEMSDTLEAVLSQNEDVLARLKVTLRRLAEMETALSLSKREKAQLEKAFQGLAQEKRVWDEKEINWRQRLTELEIRANQVNQVEDENFRLKDRLERFRRYQDKIKTQVKPYVQNLKAFAESMASQVRELNFELSQSDARTDKIQSEHSELQKKLQTETQHHERIVENLAVSHEQMTKLLQFENAELKKYHFNMENQLRDFDAMRIRETELENLIISLRKEMENQRANQTEVHRSTQTELSRLRIQASENLAHSEVAKTEKMSLETELGNLRQKYERSEEQLAALRILWTDKTKSFEKLQLANQSLESINQDLAHQLGRLRNNVL